MQLFCPSCQAAFAGNTHCPKCGGRLLSPQESFIVTGPAKPPPPDAVPPTLGGRILVGLIVAVGTAVGLRELFAAFLPADAEPYGWWATTGYPADVAVRLVATVVGGLVAGAGRDGGWLSGAGVGLAVAALGLTLDAAGGPVGWGPLAVAGVLPVLAAPAGAVGTWVWPADVRLPEPTFGGGSSLITLAAEDRRRRAGRPTSWARVAVGGILAAVVVIAADDLRGWLSRASGGAFQTGGGVRAGAVCLQLATLAVAAGGALAGATTGAGVRHGLFAGLLATAGLMTAAAGREDRPLPAADGFYEFVGVPAAPLLSAGGAGVAAGVIGLATVAGWLGGQLFPPLAPLALRKRRLVQQT